MTQHDDRTVRIDGGQGNYGDGYGGTPDPHSSRRWTSTGRPVDAEVRVAVETA